MSPKAKASTAAAWPSASTPNPTAAASESPASAPLPRARAVLLDLDGTLLDTAPDLIDSLNELRAEHGLPSLPAAQFAPAVAHGSAPMIGRGFHIDETDARFEALRHRFLALYRGRLSRKTRLYPGMEALLEHLDGAALPWGVVTNKPGWLTRPLLAALGYLERAHCVITGDTEEQRKPNAYPVREACRQLGLPPAQCLVLGDAERDIQAGRRAGTLTLVALFGYITAADRVTDWGSDGLIGHPLDVLRWLGPV